MVVHSAPSLGWDASPVHISTKEGEDDVSTASVLGGMAAVAALAGIAALAGKRRREREDA